MSKWSPFVDCEGTKHDLAHFHDQVFCYQLPPTVTRPNALEVRVNVTFNMHCFTRVPVDGEHYEQCHIYHDNREGRIFCATRASLGKSLPEIIATILDKNCYETDRKNHVLFSGAQTKGGDDYAVFFTLRKASIALPWNANLMVLSAHPRKGFRPGGKPNKFRNLLRAML